MTDMVQQSVQVEIGPQGRGRVQVPFHSLKIEMVVAQEGYPHVHPDKSSPGHSWITVQGAEPDTKVVVTFRTVE